MYDTEDRWQIKLICMRKLSIMKSDEKKNLWKKSDIE